MARSSSYDLKVYFNDSSYYTLRRLDAAATVADVVAVLEGKDPASVSFGEVFRLLENRLQLPDSFFDAEEVAGKTFSADEPYPSSS